MVPPAKIFGGISLNIFDEISGKIFGEISVKKISEISVNIFGEIYTLDIFGNISKTIWGNITIHKGKLFPCLTLAMRRKQIVLAAIVAHAGSQRAP